MNDRWQKNEMAFGAASPVSDELLTLCQRVSDELLTQEEGARLESLLIADPKARTFYLEFLELHGALQWGAIAERAAPPESASGAPAATPGRSEVSCSGLNAALPVGDATQDGAPTWSAGDGAVSAHATSLPTNAAPAEPDASDLRRPPKSPSRRRVRQLFWWHNVISRPQFSLAMSIAVLLLAFTVVAAGERILRVMFHQHQVEPHKDGGALTSTGDEPQGKIRPGGSHVGTRRIGSSAMPDTALVNLLVFRLPRLEEFERIGVARLEWTYKHRAGKPTFSVDLYGLGYVSSTSSLVGCFWEGSEDLSLRSSYGMHGKPSRRVTPIARGIMNPRTPRGRVTVEGPELQAFLQSLYDDGARGGEYVVFRLNADQPTTKFARRTGYEIVHPPEIAGKTKPSQFPALLITAKGEMPESDSAVAGSAITAHCIEPSQWSASLVRSDSITQPGPSEHGTRLVGSSSVRNTALANLLVFRLPKLEDFESVGAARLEWTYHDKAGEPRFSVDLYGLGCAASAASLNQCFWEGHFDSSLRSEYSMLGEPSRPVALVARGVINPHAPRGRIVVEGLELVEFLQSLYDDGARGGELVVFRLNADAPTADIHGRAGYEIVHPPEVAGKTVRAEFPLLQLVPSIEKGP